MGRRPGSSGDDERAALQELVACMAPMIRQLPPAYREAITLADHGNFSPCRSTRRHDLAFFENPGSVASREPLCEERPWTT